MKLTLFQTILFVIFGFAALIGIFVFATHTNTNTSTSPTNIGSVVIWGTLPKSSMQNVLIAATQANQLLKGVVYVQKDVNTLPSDLASAIATGNAPDLVLASQEELQPLAKLLVPIPTATLPTATFNSAFVEEGRIFAVPDGSGYYGVPFLVDPLMLFSNHAILSSSGIAEPPATWEALTGLVPNVALLTPTRQITRGLIGLGTYNNVHNARAILSSLFQQIGVPISSVTQNGTAANLHGSASSGVSSGRAVLNFYTQFADPTKVSYTWNASLPDSQQSFQNGDLALYIGYASEARLFKAANPNLDFNVSSLPQPATASFKSTYGLLYAFMIPRSAKNASGAYQAAALLTGSAMQAIAAPATGLAPATLAPLASLPSDPVAAVAYAEALYAKGWFSPAPVDTDTVFSGMITSVISGRTTLDNALATAERSLGALLGQ